MDNESITKDLLDAVDKMTDFDVRTLLKELFVIIEEDDYEEVVMMHVDDWLHKKGLIK